MQETIQIFRLEDKIVPPLAVLIFLIFLVWVIICWSASAKQFKRLRPWNSLQTIISSLQGFVTSVGRSNLLLIILLVGCWT